MRKIDVLLVLIIIVVAGCMFYYIKDKDNNKPEEILKLYMAYINTREYSKMYELLSDESKQTISKDEFITRNKNIYEGIEVQNLRLKTIVVDKENNNKVSYQTEMDTVAGKVAFSNSVELSKQGDKKYYINWNSTLIFPQLTSEDKVRVDVTQGERGRILDRNDVVLAKQGVVEQIGFVPGKIENREDAILKASTLLNVSKEFIEGELSATYVQEDTFVPIKTLSVADEEKIEDELLKIPGIMISDKKSRVYPYQEATSHLLGYVRTITNDELEDNRDKGYTSSSLIGKTGAEKIYEDILKGINGAEIYILDKDGNKKITLAQSEKKSGQDVKLTIDINLQTKIYNQLKGDNGLSVAINPKTGEVLAMVSTPTYNSNDFIVGFTNEEWEKLNSDKNTPMLCRYQNTWVPGSSIKPIIGAIGLTSGKFTSTDDFEKSGLSWQNSESWGAYKISTLTEYNETANLRNALIYSDNIYFAKAALKIGNDTITKHLKNIGFGEKVPFEQNMNISQFAKNNKIESEIQLADTGYGQGQVLVNPLHVASMYSAFVNEGNMIKPYLEYSGNPKSEYWIENAFSKEAADTIKDDLVQVVENKNGTAYTAKVDGVKIAGKTGTAEIKSSQDDDNGTEIGWFNAFIVSDKPEEQLLIINMIEDVKDRGGSHYLLPKVKNIFQSFLNKNSN